MNCFTHNPQHWRTPPLWPDAFGEFCFCQNSNNNTYWCLRTVNSTTNTLYCEFVTGFVSYYDVMKDPDQVIVVSLLFRCFWGPVGGLLTLPPNRTKVGGVLLTLSPAESGNSLLNYPKICIKYL